MLCATSPKASDSLLPSKITPSKARRSPLEKPEVRLLTSRVVNTSDCSIRANSPSKAATMPAALPSVTSSEVICASILGISVIGAKSFVIGESGA